MKSYVIEEGVPTCMVLLEYLHKCGTTLVSYSRQSLRGKRRRRRGQGKQNIELLVHGSHHDHCAGIGGFSRMWDDNAFHRVYIRSGELVFTDVIPSG